jgi:Tol biopolymer transport system component
VASGASVALTPSTIGSGAPRPEACVFSPDGRRIAFMRQQPTSVGLHNQIFCVDVDA